MIITFSPFPVGSYAALSRSRSAEISGLRCVWFCIGLQTLKIIICLWASDCDASYKHEGRLSEQLGGSWKHMATQSHFSVQAGIFPWLTTFALKEEILLKTSLNREREAELTENPPVEGYYKFCTIPIKVKKVKDPMTIKSSRDT